MSNKKVRVICLAMALTIALAVTLFLAPRIAISQKQETPDIVLPVENRPVEAIVEPPTLPKVFDDIAWCESTNDQSKVGLNWRTRTKADGTTERYIWSRDIGKYQINDYYHAARAKALGFDIYTEAGNTAYALVLYNENGTADWSASRPCWSDIEAWKATHKSPYYN